MSTSSSEIVVQFRGALSDCKRLFIRAARVVLESHSAADAQARQSLIRKMVDLHKGLLVKVYAMVAQADSRWSRSERELARELIDHVWQTRLEGEELKIATGRLFRDAGNLKWYSLLRPFDRWPAVREMIPDLETVVLRVANIVAKADGTVTTTEANALRTIQHEIEIHLRRLSLDDDKADNQVKERGSQATKISHQETTILTENPKDKRERPDDTPPELEDSLDSALVDLEELVGLDAVKKEIKTLTNYLNLQRHREAAGLPKHALSLHMIFKGNPGTGKTTVARIVGRIFKTLGLLKKGHLVETDRSGLVAEYAGQTGPKTNRKIDEALDGILFIDEAYSLVAASREDAYGLEAVQTIVKRMEDDRDRLVIILAGYPSPMDELLRSNPGLSSRFNTQMLFDDYAPVDLGRIYQLMCQASRYEIPSLTRAKLLLGFQWLYDARDEHFGNGRLVRNTFENSVRRLANRIAALAPITREMLTVMTADDVNLKGVPRDIWGKLDEDATRFAITCAHCDKSAHVRIDQLGRRVRCPRCKHPLQADWGSPLDA